MVGINTDGPLRDRVLKLMEEKDRIESEIREQTAVLETSGVGMQEPLVDEQGFPRSDIDVYKVRHARHAIICLQNDHKSIMKRIEQGLTDVHSEIRGTRDTVRPSTSTNGPVGNGHVNGTSEVPMEGVHEPFAVVGFVHDGSPADLAGICSEDQIIQFGSINKENFSDIMQVHDLVAHSVGQSIRLLVRRNNHVHNLTVSPRPWAHPGLLGCQVNRL